MERRWNKKLVCLVSNDYDEGPQFSAANFSKFRGPVCQNLQLTVAAPEPDQIYSISRWELQMTDTVCLANKLAIFQMSSDQYPDYFMAQSYLHI